MKSSNHSFLSPSRLAALVVACGFLAAAPSALANNTWDGGGGNGDWNVAANWGLDGLPGTGTLLFDGTGLVTTNNQFAALASITPTFAATAGAFTLNGTGITLGGNISNLSSNTQTINLPIILLAGRTVSGAGSVVLGGSITGSGGNRQLTNSLTSPATLTINGDIFTSESETLRTFTISNTATTVLNGKISNNNVGNTVASNFTKAGAGILTLNNGNSDLTGVFTHNGGTIEVGASSVGSGLSVTKGPMGKGTITYQTTTGDIKAVGGAQTIGNNINSTGHLTVTGSNNITFTGQFSNFATGTTPQVINMTAGTAELSGSIIIRDVSQGVGARNLTWRNDGAGDLKLSGVISNGAATATSNVLLLAQSTGKIIVSGANTYDSAVNTSLNQQSVAPFYTTGTIVADNSSAFGGSASGLVTLGAGTLKLGGSPTLTLNVSNFTFNGGSTLSFDLSGTSLSDTISITGAFTKAATNVLTTYTIDLNNSANYNGNYLLLSWGGATTFSVSDFTVINKGVNGTLVQGANSLSFVAVPEPSHYAVAIAGMLGMAIFFRNRRRASNA
jgi:fibronectin-binding autotransporter adhesin